VPLALRARSRGLERSAVYAALDSGELVISWLNRGTLHLVHRDDFWWLHALTTPQLRTANKRRLTQEGVTRVDAKLKRIAKLLADGPMLRKQIGQAIGVTGQGLTHLLLAASIDGTVIRGPVRGKQQTFVLARDHIGGPPAIERGAAVRELIKRYRRGHPRATDADAAYWSGLPLSAVRCPPEEGASLLYSGDALAPKLLPPFDPYIMGWKERSFAIPPEHATRVTPGGGMFRAVVLVDGTAAGTWSRAGGRVAIEPFARPIEGLDDEIADVERFLT